MSFPCNVVLVLMEVGAPDNRVGGGWWGGLPLSLLPLADVHCGQDEEEQDQQGTDGGAKDQPGEGGGGGCDQLRWGFHHLQGDVGLLAVEEVALSVQLPHRTDHTAIAIRKSCCVVKRRDGRVGSTVLVELDLLLDLYVLQVLLLPADLSPHPSLLLKPTPGEHRRRKGVLNLTLHVHLVTSSESEHPL